MTERMPEIENGTQPAFALIGRDDRRLDFATALDRLCKHIRIATIERFDIRF